MTAVEESVVAVSGSVWATGQDTPAVQRRGRYLPESMAHPAKMLPAVAAHAIAAYSRPGELVLDPMCGIGTTLVEALHQDRRAVGVEYETRWAEIARTNIQHTGLVDGHDPLPGRGIRADTLLGAGLHRVLIHAASRLVTTCAVQDSPPQDPP